jgi:amino acid adenylation domain-containing protein
MSQSCDVKNIGSNSETLAIPTNRLTEAEKHWILVDWNKTQTDYPQDKCIHQLFEEQVEHTPDAVAVVFENEQLTYRELNQRANQLAHYLQTLGVSPEVLVGICIERSAEMIVGILGILKAGGAYVPLDPAYPQERLDFMIEDANLSIVLTQSKLIDRLPVHQARSVYLDKEWQEIAQQNKENLIQSIKSDNLAYVIYTSGSTGKPKGVLIEHKSLVNYTCAVNTEYAISSSDRILQFASLNFDIAAEEIYTCLTSGATLILRNELMLDSPQIFLQRCQDWEISVVNLPTAYWHELTAMLAVGKLRIPSSWRLVAIGGEQALQTRVAEWHQYVGKQVRLVNSYGPTEATINASIYDLSEVVEQGLQQVLIGRPIANTSCFILDQYLQPVPTGVAGELYIGGDGLARGYLNRPDLTAEKFIPNPFSSAVLIASSNEPNSRLYQTGDLARYLADGNIEFLGRIDHQVKIRGFRIELGEIESALTQHPEVREATVIAREDCPGDKRLVAYLSGNLTTDSIPAVRTHLRDRLPDYMMPSAFVLLDAMPLTPNGKIDRRALPAPDLRPELELTFVAPRTSTEEIVAHIWSDVLGIVQIGVHDNFFSLGGHSLLATQVMARIYNHLTVEIPLRSLFEAPTIAGLSQQIDIELTRETARPSTPLLPISRPSEIPLSFVQSGLWFLDRINPNSDFYSIPHALRLNGQLNVAALEQSINAIIHRHEALRTNFVSVAEQPIQVIAPTLEWKLKIIDLSSLPENQREAEAQRLAIEAARQPFDLERETLLRGLLLQLDETDSILLLTVHHIVFDGWSVGVFERELTELYRAFDTGTTSNLPALLIQPADLVLWQQQESQRRMLESQLAYWQQQLKEIPTLLELPTDNPRPAVQTFQGATQSFVLSPELYSGLSSYSQQQGVTLFMTLLTAFQILLCRYTGTDDIFVGTPVANRNRQELEQLIGFFVNTIVLRTDLSGNPTFAELLERVREVALQAYAHPDLPFEQLVTALQPERSLSHSPLVQVMFAVEEQSRSNLALSGLEVSTITLENHSAKFDLTLTIENTEQEAIVHWEYNTDLFEAETIARISTHFQMLLQGIVNNPQQQISDLPLLTEAENHQFLFEWNQTQTDYPQDKCIHQLFEEQVERHPDAIAVLFEDEQLTYRELNNKANKLARYLQDLGVQSETLVGICVERSLEMITGVLGILKSGGAYVPLDPAYPQERLDFIIEDANLSIVVTKSPLIDRLSNHQIRPVALDREWSKIAQQGGENLTRNVKSDNVAYVIYTSGSTGKPKGVLIEHKSLLNYTCAAIAKYDINENDLILQFTSLNFDVSAEEIYTCLITGASLVLRTESMLASNQTFLQRCQEWGITVAMLPTAYWHDLTAKLESDRLSLPPALKLVVVGGERVLVTKVEQWQEYVGSQVRLVNAYGPTEATISALWCDLSALNLTVSLSEVPVGRPVANTQTYILDNHLQPVPIGVAGELYIGGHGLARGYLNRPELTQEKFIPHPFSNEPGSRLYKTGDLARYLPDGNIEFIGRIDHQVKIRGFRIELGEVEVTLSQHPDVREAVVIAREDKPGDKRLVAYVTSNLTPDRLSYQRECLLELDGNTFNLRTEDISNKGIGLVDPPAMAEHTPVRLHLLLPRADKAQWFEGTIAWSHSSSVGIQFHLTPTEQTLLDQSITYLLETQGLWKNWQRTIATSLWNYLKGKLPDYMMPSAIVLLDAMPLTPNGKINRRALPAPDRTQERQDKDFVAPSTPTEKFVAAIWQEVLGLSQVSIHDNFFELGGHSLLSVQIIYHVCKTFSIDLSISTLFESPTIAALSQIIKIQLAVKPNDQAIKKSDIMPARRDSTIPLSFSQSYLWYTEKHYAGDRAANSPVTLKLTGSLSPKILEQSLNEIICRHEILRTTFPIVEGEPIQNIYPFLNVPLETIDLQHLPKAVRVLEAERIISEVMNHCFDLATAPLVKTVLVQISDEEQWLLILMHHLITDGWSYGVFMQELETLYTDFLADRPSSLPKPPFQYADFAIWQRNYFREEVVAKHLHYWEKHLADLPVPLDLLPVMQPGADKSLAAEHHFYLPVDLTRTIEIFSNAHSVTSFITLLTALKILLSQWSQQRDILIVSTMANRNTAEIEQLLGCFIGDLPVRCQVKSDETGAALLKKVKQAVTEGITNTLSAEKIWEPFEEEIKTLRTILLTMVSAVKWSSQALKCEELNINFDRGLWDERHFPLELYVMYPTETDQAIEFHASYSRTTFTAETIECFLQSYQAVLDKLVRHPESLISDF